MGAIMTMPAKLSSAAVTIALALLIGSASNTSYAQDGKTSDSVSLRGAGSTFAAPLYKKCIEEYAVSQAPRPGAQS
jgi:ABC-type phosphate transport system substrate-binding protein